MKQISLLALILAFTFTAVTPQFALAKNGWDDDRDRYEYEDSDNEHDDKKSKDGLEVEADVYTDTTIVKVELNNGNSKKTVFTTEADTRAEVVTVVADRFDLTEAEVEAVLDFEVEDRASRTNERAKISFQNNRPVKVCVDDSDNELEVEADVFTNTTIVKVELENGTKSVFETNATTSDDIAAAVVSRYSALTLTEVKAVLDVDVENRASTSADLIITSSVNDDCDNWTNSDDKKPSTNDTELRNRIAELQKLIETLMRLLTARLGN